MTILKVVHPKKPDINIEIDFPEDGTPVTAGTDDIVREFIATCLPTANTGDQVCGSSPFASQPRVDSYIEMQINGVDVTVVYGTKVGGFAYFSNDLGSTAIQKSELVAGSTAHWITGNFQLDATDEVRVRYEFLNS